MITFKSITELEELVELTPFFIEGYHAMNKKRKVFEVDVDGFVKTLLGVLNTVPKNGIVVALDNGKPAGFGVAFDDTPAFSQNKELLLWALYVRPEYRGDLVVEIFEEAKRLATEQGYKVMKAFNARFTGGMYRLFEGRLKMRRHRVQFNITL